MLKEHKETLEQNGVDKVFFYFEGSPLANNIYTTCLLINTKEKRIEARGVSICSLLDTFSRVRGKSKSSGRALKALIRKENSFKINGLGRDGQTINKTITIKTAQDNTKFLETKTSEFLRLNQKITNIKTQGSYCFAKYKFKLPTNYPIFKASEMFKYKSEFRPIPANKMEVKVLEATNKVEA